MLPVLRIESASYLDRDCNLSLLAPRREVRFLAVFIVAVCASGSHDVCSFQHLVLILRLGGLVHGHARVTEALNELRPICILDWDWLAIGALASWNRQK